MRNKQDMLERYPNSRLAARQMEKKRKKTKRRWIWGTLFLLVLSALAYAFFFVDAFRQAINSTTQEILTQNIRTNKRTATDPFSILLIGIDQGGEYGHTEVARADTLVVVTVNPQTKETTLVNIPRDTLAPMIVPNNSEGYGMIDKINHSYSYGGVSATVNTVQNFLQVPIDEYIEINIDGLIDLVDAIGGVTVTPPNTFDVFEEGKTVHLDGYGANLFARLRYQDPLGVAGREHRQRLLIEALAKKLLSPSLLLNYQSVFNTIRSNVKMSFTFDELVGLKDTYAPALESFKQDSFEIKGVDISGGYYDLILDPEHLRVTNKLRTNLNEPTITLENLISKKVSSTTYDIPVFRLYESYEYIDANGNPTAPDGSAYVPVQVDETAQIPALYETSIVSETLVQPIYVETTQPLYTETQVSSAP